MRNLILACATALLAIGLQPARAAETAMTETAFRDTNTHHPFRPPVSKRQWESRAKDLRRQILVSAGLYPMPVKTPLKPIVTGGIQGPDYTVENVAIESMPGYWLCGSVYRPKGARGKLPAIANPHGHWERGRLQIAEDIPPAAPPPAKPAPGRGNLVAIGVNLARMGFVVFAYDMIGYNDTNQTPEHRQFANDPLSWQWGISAMGLQLWNSIRAVDYLCSRPDVDASRIGATGGSGGGSQTFLLTAVDDRVKASVPVNMVSCYMQGGCLCENGPGLRLGTDNAEIAALAAPRPQLLVCCTGDWTRNVPHEEGPAIRKVYDLTGSGDAFGVVQFNYEHNYNIESREAMYAWFGRWLKGDPDPARFRERPFELDAELLRVWSDDHPLPASALTEPGVIEALKARRTKTMAGAAPRSERQFEQYKEEMRPALAACLGLDSKDLPAAASGHGVPGSVVLVAAGDASAQADGLREELKAKGMTVFEVDPGSLADDPMLRWDGFYTCYNRTALGDGVAKVLSAWRRAAAQSPESTPAIAGLGQAGLCALMAAALTPGSPRVLVEWGQFDPESDKDYLERVWAPSIRGLGGPVTALRLLAGGEAWIANTGGWKPGRLGELYRACGGSLKSSKQSPDPRAAAAWLSRR